MENRIACVERGTAETRVSLTVNLDGSGSCQVRSPVGFLLHLLSSFCKHGMFDISGRLEGDLEVDQHHLVEDTGIVLGMAFAKALGDCRGIFRAGSFLFPMDETLARAAVDFGGRAFLVCNAGLSGVPLVSRADDGGAAGFQTDTIEDFWQGFVSGAKCNLHLDLLRGRSDHHKMEALAKAASRAIREAVSIDPRRGSGIPSSKGVIV
jgi:imidazoleglycerol-phosphate dehydratase